MDKREKKFLWISLAIVLLVIALAVGAYLSGNDDNLFEETAEALLEESTGIAIDFTPGSPEL